MIDVREPDEYRGELGHLVGAVLSPLSALLNGSATLPLDRPLVTVSQRGSASFPGAGVLVKTFAKHSSAPNRRIGNPVAQLLNP